MTRRGCRRGGRRRHGARRARGHGRARCRSARSRAGRVRRRGTAPRAARSPTSSACRPSWSHPGPACSRRSASSVHPSSARSWSRGRRPSSRVGSRRGAGSAGRAGRRRSSPVVTSTSGSTVATQVRVTRSSSATSTSSRRCTRSATGTCAPTSRSRWSRCERACRGAAPLTVTDLPEPERAAARGPAVVAEPDCTLWVPDGLGRHSGSGGRVDRGAGVNPAELQILGSRLASVADEMGAVLRRAASSPNIKERADCSAARVHRLRRAPRPGRAHPGAPRFDAGVGGGGDRHRAADRADAQRSVRGRHPPQRPDDGRAGARRRRARGLGREPRAPRRRRRHRARLDAARRVDHRRGGTPTPARLPSTIAHSRRVVDVVAHARRAARRSRRPTRCEPARRAPIVRARARDGRRDVVGGAVRRDPRLRGTTHARRAPRLPRRSLRRVRRARLGRPASRAADADRASWSRCASSTTTSPSTSPAPTRSGPAT